MGHTHYQVDSSMIVGVVAGNSISTTVFKSNIIYLLTLLLRKLWKCRYLYKKREFSWEKLFFFDVSKVSVDCQLRYSL